MGTEVYVIARYDKVGGSRLLYLEDYSGNWTPHAEFAVFAHYGNREEVHAMAKYFVTLPGDLKAAICMAVIEPGTGNVHLVVNPNLKPNR